MAQYLLESLIFYGLLIPMFIYLMKHSLDYYAIKSSASPEMIDTYMDNQPFPLKHFLDGFLATITRLLLEDNRRGSYRQPKKSSLKLLNSQRMVVT